MNSNQNVGKYGTYLSAYGIAVKRGYKGTEQDWLRSLKGEPGERVELRYAPGVNRLQWHYREGVWQDLMDLDELQTELQQATQSQLEEGVRRAEEIEALVSALSRTAQEYAGFAREAAETAGLRTAEAETAGAAAMTAKEQAELARQGAEQAKEESREAALAAAAYSGALTAQSWAAGGTGTRENEDTDNAMYWAKQAEGVSSGGVWSFHGRSGFVQPQSGDYTAGMVEADPAGSAEAVRAELGEDLRRQRERVEQLETAAWELDTEVTVHGMRTISGLEGAHGLRYADGELHCREAGVWKALPLGGGNVYACTGKGDDSAISELVNSFLCGTGKWAGRPCGNLKLTVRGQVGLSVVPWYGTGELDDPFCFFSFDCEDGPGGSVTIDWTEAVFPARVDISGTTALLGHRGDGAVLIHEGLDIALRTGTASDSSGGLYFLWAGYGARVQVRDSRLRDEGVSSGIPKVAQVYVCPGGHVQCSGLTAKSRALTPMFTAVSGTLGFDNCFAEGRKGLYQTGGQTDVNASRFLMEREGMRLSGGELTFRGSLCSASSQDDNNGALIAADLSSVRLSDGKLKSCFETALSLSGQSSLSAVNMEIACEDSWSSHGISVKDSDLQMHGCRVEGAVGLLDLGGNLLTIGDSRFTGVSRGIWILGGSSVALTGCLCEAKGIAAGEEDPFFHGYEDGFGLCVESAASYPETKLSAQGCGFRGYRSEDSDAYEGYGLAVTGESGGENNLLTLCGCVFDTAPLGGRVQTGAVRLGDTGVAPSYAILGCTFYTADIMAGGSGITMSGSPGKYMPEGSNFFGVTG